MIIIIQMPEGDSQMPIKIAFSLFSLSLALAHCLIAKVELILNFMIFFRKLWDVDCYASACPINAKNIDCFVNEIPMLLWWLLNRKYVPRGKRQTVFIVTRIIWMLLIVIASDCVCVCFKSPLFQTTSDGRQGLLHFILYFVFFFFLSFIFNQFVFIFRLPLAHIAVIGL